MFTPGIYSLIYRDDDDYDLDFYTVDPVPPDMKDSAPSPREQLEVCIRDSVRSCY